MDYDYLNARIRSMKGRLLSPAALEGLIQKPDLGGVIAELERTPYRGELEKASIRYSGIRALEEALRREMAGTFSRILSIARGDEAEKYVRLLLARWDVQNIKTLIRGKAMHIPPTEILECLVPAGDLDEAALAELLKQPDIKAVIDLLATWRIRFARPLTLALAEFQENRDPSVLEYALDRFSCESSLYALREEADDDGIMREMVRSEIDVINLKTAFRLIRDGVSADEARAILIRRGKVPRYRARPLPHRNGERGNSGEDARRDPLWFSLGCPCDGGEGRDLGLREGARPVPARERGVVTS